MSRYAVVADLPTYVQSALSSFTQGELQAKLDAMSARADSYLKTRFPLPLTSWGTDLTEAVVSMAVWRLFSDRGMVPSIESNMNMERLSKTAEDWLLRV